MVISIRRLTAGSLPLFFASCFSLQGVSEPPTPAEDISSKQAGESDPHWPAEGTVFPAATCGAAAPVIDGRFTGWVGALTHEWSCAPSAAGRFGRLYLRVVGNSLYALNDWRLRDDLPVCPQMFNQFTLIVPGQGTWSVKVYGDQHVDVTLNGKKHDAAAGAAGFATSPNLSRAHAMFEFRIDAPPQSPWPMVVMTVQESDPGVSDFIQTQTGNPAECSNQVAPMVDEPNVFQATLVPCVSAGIAAMAIQNPRKL